MFGGKVRVTVKTYVAMKLCFSFISAINAFKGLSSKIYRERIMFLYLAHCSSDTGEDIFDISRKSEGELKARDLRR